MYHLAICWLFKHIKHRSTTFLASGYKTKSLTHPTVQMMLETLFIRSREQGAASLTMQEQVSRFSSTKLSLKRQGTGSYWHARQLDVSAQPKNPGLVLRPLLHNVTMIQLHVMNLSDWPTDAVSGPNLQGKSNMTLSDFIELWQHALCL